MTEQEPEQWKRVPGGPDFEVSWDGNFRSADRISPSGRHLKGKPVASRTGKNGYPQVDYVNADGKRVTRELHAVQLEAFAGKCPDGMQSRHWDDNPLNNRWRPGTEEESRAAGGNLFWGDGGDQHRDKVRNNGGQPLPAPPPQHDCINHERCGGKTRNPGKRCVPCVEQVGRDAGQMLRDGEGLPWVRDHFGFKGTDWVYDLAVKFGGWTGTKDEAWAQRRSRLQRVTAKVRGRLRGGNAGSPPASAGAGTAPFGRLPHMQKLGQSRTSTTPGVAERDGREVARDAPKVTERSHIPYPADLVPKRERPARGGTGRSR